MKVNHFYTGTRNKLYRQAECTEGDHRHSLYHNIISNPNKERKRLKKLDESLHIGDATSMSKVSESVGEIQIQAINISY